MSDVELNWEDLAVKVLSSVMMAAETKPDMKMIDFVEDICSFDLLTQEECDILTHKMSIDFMKNLMIRLSGTGA